MSDKGKQKRKQPSMDPLDKRRKVSGEFAIFGYKEYRKIIKSNLYYPS